MQGSRGPENGRTATDNVNVRLKLNGSDDGAVDDAVASVSVVIPHFCAILTEGETTSNARPSKMTAHLPRVSA